MSNREHQILAILRQEPMIPQQDLAQRLGISRSAVAGHIMNLTRKGLIQGKGYILAPQRYAVVLGGANIDLSGRAQAALIPGDSTPGTLSASAGGVGRNIADNLARLGSQCQLISVLGDDAWGAQLKAATHEAGVGLDHCLQLSGVGSSCYLSIHDTHGEMQLALNDMALIERLDAEQLARRQGILEQAAILVVDANLGPAALAYLFERFAHKPILVDPVSQAKAARIAPYLAAVDTLKPNRLEAELLSGIALEQPADLPRVAQALHDKGVRRVLISLGAEGAYASEAGEGYFIPAVQSQIVNVTGAGDALMAGLAHGHLCQWTWSKSVAFALAAARLALAVATTINPSMSETAVNALLEESQPC